MTEQEKYMLEQAMKMSEEEEKRKKQEMDEEQKMIEMAIAIPYFRKLMSGQPLDEEWLKTHIDAVCSLGTKQTFD